MLELLTNNVKPQSMAILFDLKEWISEQLQDPSVVKFRIFNNNIYKFNGTVPFISEDLEAELEEGKWILSVRGADLPFTIETQAQIDANIVIT